MELREGYEEWKIYPLYEAFYIDCIQSSAHSALSSWEDINNITSDSELIKNHSLMLIDLSENIINQAGIISRYFFPSKDRHNHAKDRIHTLRGEKLKQFYKIQEDNILADRKFRNHIEHFDENLDKFLNNLVAGTIIPKTIFNNSSEINSVTVVFKAYITEEFKFISLNKEVELLKLIKEISRIYNLSNTFTENGNRLR